MTMRKNHDTKLEIQRQPNQTQIKQNETKQNNQPNQPNQPNKKQKHKIQLFISWPSHLTVLTNL